jgi:hypothetical protein
MESKMNELLAQAVAAHGGLERWNGFDAVTATFVTGGQLWAIKGVVQDAAPHQVTVALHEERAAIAPFGGPAWGLVFTPDRVAIETRERAIVAERASPRAAFAGHGMDTPWDPLQRAYFNGYTLWTYLTTPFLLTLPGFAVAEIAPWREGDELWRGVRATFPPYLASHSPEQEFYFGEDVLLRRHDYHVDVAGGFAAAHYVSDVVEADGLRLPTRRRAYLRDDRLRPLPERLLISIDLSDVRFH